MSDPRSDRPVAGDVASPTTPVIVITDDGTDRLPSSPHPPPRPVPIDARRGRIDPVGVLPATDIDRLIKQAVQNAPPSPAPPEPPVEQIEAAALNLCDAMEGDVHGWADEDGARLIPIGVAMSGPGVEPSPYHKTLSAAYHHAVCWLSRARLVSVTLSPPPADAGGRVIPKSRVGGNLIPCLHATPELWNRRRAGRIFGRPATAKGPNGTDQPSGLDGSGDQDGETKGRSTKRVAEKSSKKGKNIAARMLKVLAANPECVSWSSRKWADALDCSAGTVKESKTWTETLKAAKALLAAEAGRRMDRSSTHPNGRRKSKRP